MSETTSFLRMMATYEDERDQPTRASNLRFIAQEIERLTESDKALARVWQAMGIAQYTGLHVAEHVAELKAKVDRLLSSGDATRLRLVADFLREYADRLGNDGCNDWELPDYMDVFRLPTTPDLADWDYTRGVMPPNWMVVAALADWIETELLL